MVVIDESVVMQRKYVKRFPIKTPNRRCSKGADQITENGGSLAQDVAGTLRPFPQENAWRENKAKRIHKKAENSCDATTDKIIGDTPWSGPSYSNKTRANSETKTCQNNLQHFKTQTALSFMFWGSWPVILS